MNTMNAILGASSQAKGTQSISFLMHIRKE